jgi:hypothetical protein
MDRTLTDTADDKGTYRPSPAAKRKARRRSHLAVATRSVLALALAALGWVAIIRFEQDVSFCAANWLLHPHTDCWIRMYYGY